MQKWFCIWYDLAKPNNRLNLVSNQLSYQNIRQHCIKTHTHENLSFLNFIIIPFL